MRILITGARGFIGLSVASALIEQGADLILCDNGSRGPADTAFESLLSNPSVTYFDVDLTKSTGWDILPKGIDAIFHFAAINGTRYFYERPYEVINTNLLCTIEMLHWHLKNDSNSHIIWTSSSETYASVNHPIPTSENTSVGISDVFNPRYSYAASKLAGEVLLINYARTENKPFTIVRPHNIYGPRMGTEHVIPEFIMRLINKENPFLIYGAEQTRCFCYIDDFVNGMLATLAHEEAKGQIFHLGDDRNEIKIIDLAQMLHDIANTETNFKVEPAPAGSVERRKPDITKAKDLLGFRPVMDLRLGLKSTLDWYSEETL